MMNYEMFIAELKNEISILANIPRENITFAEAGEKYAPDSDRLLVKFAEHDDAWEVCGLYVQNLYEEYINGEDMKTILNQIINDIENLESTNIYEKTKSIRSYAKAKDQLFIRLLNANKYAVDLQDAVYKTLGDIALVLYMKVSDENNAVISTKIRQPMIRQWNVDFDEVFKSALINTYRMAPPRIYNWLNMVVDPSYEGDEFMNVEGYPINQDMIGNCLSTTKKTNGAVAVFLPGVAEQLAYMLDSDFYMVFTSVHEVMIHKSTEVDPKDLINILKDTMEEATPKEDYLTSKIYKYEKDTGKFSVV